MPFAVVLTPSIRRHAAIVCLAASTLAAPALEAQSLCQPEGQKTALPDIPEASGLAASRRTPGRLWAHSDEAPPILFALDTSGRVTARIRVTGAAIQDWEAVATGPCPSGSCIYIADIGDNESARKRISVYRLAEPEGSPDSIAVDAAFHETYPDGPHDAETLLVTAAGDLFIVTKGDAAALYKFPHDPTAGATHPLERIGGAGAATTSRAQRITDGSLSPDGAWVVLRTLRQLAFYRSAEFLAGNWQGGRRVDLSALGEPQGEGVAFAAGESVFVAGEGGSKARPGTFAHLTCGLDR